ncbi:MAG: RMD1 family protein [Mariprofundaceae bacterium]|nr:RMD1 family protein [Mariprofundaceae bacterium]
MQQRCTAYVLARRFDFDAIGTQLAHNYRLSHFRNTLHIEEAGGNIFLFDYGVVLFWGLNVDGERRILDVIAPFLVEPLSEAISDDFTFEHTNEAATRIRSDYITLSDDDVMTKLALSHGIAQSVKLAELESYAERTIESTAHIPRNMAESGSSRLSRKEIARMRGRLFLVESDILLHHALLDTPEFFWEYPELEMHYSHMASYLDVTPRVEVLNKKLQVIHDMFGMLADEQKHKHSSMLEWIIIWLIAIEILIFILHDFFKII